MWKILSGLQDKMRTMRDEEVQKVIEEGKEKARSEATRNMKDVKRLLRLV